MPVEFEVLTDPGLVYVRYFGQVKSHDITTALDRFARVCSAHAAHPHLFNLSEVTGFEIDYTEFFNFLGLLAEVYPKGSGERLFVFLAPPGPPAELAAAIRVPLDGSETILLRVAPGPEEALDILGLDHGALTDKLEPELG